MASPLNRYNLGLFNSGTYIPFVCDITSVTQEDQATVTTSQDHAFVVGAQVQFQIPPEWGMRQLNRLKARVIDIPASNEITVNINTTNFDAFVIPVTPMYVVIDPAQVAGIGDFNFGNFSINGFPPEPNTVPGAFLNEPPS